MDSSSLTCFVSILCSSESQVMNLGKYKNYTKISLPYTILLIQSYSKYGKEMIVVLIMQSINISRCVLSKELNEVEHKNRLNVLLGPKTLSPLSSEMEPWQLEGLASSNNATRTERGEHALCPVFN